MRAVGQADRCRGAAEFFHRDDVGEVAHAGAAVFLLHRDAEQAERAQFLPQVRRELVAVVDVRRARRDLVRREVAYRGAQHVDGFAVFKAKERVFHRLFTDIGSFREHHERFLHRCDVRAPVAGLRVNLGASH